MNIIPNPSGLFAVAFMLAIVALHFMRPRSTSRGVGGLFLWHDALRERGGRAISGSSRAEMIRDIAAAFLLLVLACGAFSPDHESDTIPSDMIGLLQRGLLGAAVISLLVMNWKNARESSRGL